MNSAIYYGTVTHNRYGNPRHSFRYRQAMLCIDLSELDHVFRGRWLWSVDRRNIASFHRRDYLPNEPAERLDGAVRNLVQREIGRRPLGPIRLLTYPRLFGHVFNPVSFYYCLNSEGTRTEAIVAEITNTPWKQRHAYVLDAARQGDPSDVDTDTQNGWKRFDLAKCFHISPFMSMEQRYVWRLSEPGETLRVHMESREADERVFDATMTMRRRELTGSTLARMLIRYPLMSLRILAAIYFQALRLRLKGATFHTHPDKRISTRTRQT